MVKPFLFESRSCVYSYIHMFYLLIQYVHSFIICLYSIYRESVRKKEISNKPMHWSLSNKQCLRCACWLFFAIKWNVKICKAVHIVFILWKYEIQNLTSWGDIIINLKCLMTDNSAKFSKIACSSSCPILTNLNYILLWLREVNPY